MEALVLNGNNNVFTVEALDGEVFVCTIKGKVLSCKENVYNPLACGDIVEIEKKGDGKAVILSLKKRVNEIKRLNTKTYTAQTLASNIDLALCITTPSSPPFRPRFVDRVIAQCEKEEIPILIVINKCDLGLPESIMLRVSAWQSLGYEVMKTSATQNINIEELRKKIVGLKVAVIGQSGVGKSSLLNAYDPNLKLKTASLSTKYDRGSHTTTQANLIRSKQSSCITSGSCGQMWDQGYIIDTPGVRNFSLCDIPPDKVIQYFKEIKEASNACKFGLSCRHVKDEGCAVLKALEQGNILQDRYESYLRVRDEVLELTKMLR